MDAINVKSKVWLCSLLPFGRDDRTDDKITPFQDLCYRKNVFGIGWSIGDTSATDCKSFIILYKQWMDEECEKNNWIKWSTKSLETALSNMFKVDINDYVFVRLRNGEYMIGKVSSKAKIMKSDDPIFNGLSVDDQNRLLRMSCYATVEKWEKKNLCEVPAEVVGRFSQRNQRTFVQIHGDRRFRFVLYAKAILKELEDYNRKIPLGKANFHVALDYQELENLVAMYICKEEKKKDNDIYLLPSTCKSSTPFIEFYFVTENNELITCQVKNQRGIEVEKYKEYSQFKTIYLFSGLWQEDETIVDGNIVMIGRKYLYDILKASSYFKDKLDRYYQFDSVCSNRFNDIYTQIERDNGFRRTNSMKKNKGVIKYYVPEKTPKIDVSESDYDEEDAFQEELETTRIYFVDWNTYYDALLDCFVHLGDDEIDERIVNEFNLNIVNL